MIIQTSDRTLIKTAPKETAEYFIDRDNMAQVGLILQGMYSDPVLAVIREYTANAVDAHAQAGKQGTPVIVRLPTAFNPVFEVEDEGPGLSVADTKRLLLGYGSSGDHKRTSNDYIGGFGIGCKCALSIVDQFTYTIWHGGMKRIWSSYKDEQGLSKADLVFEAVSERGSHTGVKVTVPVADSAKHQFHDRVQQALRYFSVTPTVEGLENGRKISKFSPIRSICVPSSFDSTIVFDSDSGVDTPMIVMGGVGYPIDFDKVFDGNMPTDRRVLTSKTVIYAPVGTVQLAPSREALQYTLLTRKRIKDITEPLGPDRLKDTLQSLLKQCDTSAEKVSMWSQLHERSYSRLLSTVSEDIEKQIPWLSRRGLAIFTGHISDLKPEDAARIGYEYKFNSIYTTYDALGNVDPKYRSCIGVEELGGSEANSGWEKDVFVTAQSLRILFLGSGDSVPSSKSLAYSVWKNEGYEAGTTENAKTHLFLVREDAKQALYTKYPWLEELIRAFPDVVLDKSTWLLTPPEDVPFTAQHWKSLDRQRKLGGGAVSLKRSSNRTKVAAHSVKLVKLDVSTLDKYVKKSSDNWTPATISSKALSGKPYVLIDKFNICDASTFGYHPGNKALMSVINMCPALSGTDIYGLRLRDKDSSYGMKPLDEYLADWMIAEWAKLDEKEKILVKLAICSNGCNVIADHPKFVSNELIDVLLSDIRLVKDKKLLKEHLSCDSYYASYRCDEIVKATDSVLEKWTNVSTHEHSAMFKTYSGLEEATRTGNDQVKLTGSLSKIVPLIKVALAFSLGADSSDRYKQSAAAQRVRTAFGLVEWHNTEASIRLMWYLELVQAMCKEVPESSDIVLVQLDKVPGLAKQAVFRLLDKVISSRRTTVVEA